MSQASAVRLPLGLCGTLVIAAALVSFPRWADPLTRPARWLMCLPLRAWPRHSVEASSTVGLGPVLDSGRAAQAWARLAEEAVRGACAHVGAEVAPLICRVLERRAPRTTELPTLLVLDRHWHELDGCSGLVTRGDCLVGFLGQPSDGDDLVTRTHAVVRCVHASPRGLPPRRLLAATEIDGMALRFVVEPGSRIDAWPLRVGLLEDPYLASRVGGAGGEVRTCRTTTLGVTVPEGLLLGTLRVWGYAERDAPTLPVGFFVEPAFDPFAIATVVLWHSPERSSAASRYDSAAQTILRPARGALLPNRQRLYLLTGPLEVPRGAAVLARDGQLFGVVDEAGPGDAVARAFAVVGRSWSLLLLPDDRARTPIECSARVVAVVGDTVDVQLGSPVADFTGDVLSGAHGLHCPTGLWIGRVAGHEGGRLLRILHPVPDLSAVSVCVRPESAP